MATLKLVQLPHHKREDGTIQIVFRITENRKSKYIKSGYAVPESCFDPNAFGKWVKKHPDANLINHALEVKRHKIMSEMVAADVIDKPIIEAKKTTLIEAIRQQMLSHEARGQYAAFTRLKINIDYLSQSFNINVPIENITKAQVNKYIDFRYRKGNNDSTVKKNLMDIAAALNFVGYEGQNLFSAAAKTIKPKPTKREKLNIDEIRLLETATLSGLHDLARDMFLTSYYMHGARFESVATIKKEDIASGVLSYQMNKGAKFKTITIHEKLRRILDKYNGAPFLFPVIKTTYNVWEKKTVVGNANSLINKYLRLAAAKAGVKTDVHFHMARHTFATLLLYEGVSISIVKDALGHSKEATTRIYTKSFQDDAINNEAIKLYDK